MNRRLFSVSPLVGKSTCLGTKLNLVLIPREEWVLDWRLTTWEPPARVLEVVASLAWGELHSSGIEVIALPNANRSNCSVSWHVMQYMADSGKTNIPWRRQESNQKMILLQAHETIIHWIIRPVFERNQAVEKSQKCSSAGVKWKKKVRRNQAGTNCRRPDISLPVA